MHTINLKRTLLSLAMGASLSVLAGQVSASTDMSQSERMDAKRALLAAVDGKAKQVQVMNDMIFSFGELGFQEFETSAYLTSLLEENGFEVEYGISGIPTAWMATSRAASLGS